MKLLRRILVPWSILAVLLLVASLAHHVSALWADEQAADTRELDDAAPVKTIPLESIYGIPRQIGQPYPAEVWDHATFGEALSNVYNVVRKTGASNILLVHAPNFAEAVWQSSSMIGGSQSADTAVGADGDEGERVYWVVAHLGSGHTEPPTWVVKSLEVRAASIRLVFAKRQLGENRWTTLDRSPHVVWARVGPLAPGVYNVELYDTDAKRVVILRSVNVTGGN